MGLRAIDVATAAIWRIALTVALAALIGGCGQAIDSAASLRGPLCAWLESSARDIGSDESQPVEIKARCLPRGRGTSLGMIDEMLFPRSLNVTRTQVEWLEVVSEEKMAVVYSSRTGASPLLWQLPANYAWGTPPAMEGRSIVWCFAGDPVSSCRPSPLAGTSLSVHSLTTGGDVVVCKRRTALQPAISGSWVVWTDLRDERDSGAKPIENSDIFAVNLDDGLELPVCTARGNQTRPVVSVDWVVWEDCRNKTATGTDIYAYNLRRKYEVCICRARGDQSSPSISGDWVVWSDARSTDSEADIYGYNLTTKETGVICDARGKQLYPRVSGSWVVWQDHRNKAASGSDIYAFHLAFGKEYAVCTDPGDQSYPAVSGR